MLNKIKNIKCRDSRSDQQLDVASNECMLVVMI